MLVELGFAAELSNSLGRRLDVIDLEEQVWTRTLVAAVQTAPHVVGPDLKATLFAGGARLHLPSEQLAVELARQGRMLDPQLEE
jgi:hypothetical protein